MYRIEIYEDESRVKPVSVFTDPAGAVFALSGWREEYAVVSPVVLPDIEPYEIQGYANKLHEDAGIPNRVAPVVDWWYEILISVANVQNEYQPTKAEELLLNSLEVRDLCNINGIRLFVDNGTEGSRQAGLLLLGKNEETLWNMFKEAQKIIESEHRELIVASSREAMNFRGGAETMWARSIYDRSYANWIGSL